MAHFELSDEQAAMLRQILESYLSDLRMEISHTDSPDFRDKLKKKKAFLEQLLLDLAA